MSYLMHHFQMMKEYWQQLHGIRTFNYGMFPQEHTGTMVLPATFLYKSLILMLILHSRKTGPVTLKKGHEGSVSSCCFSADGKLIACMHRQLNY